MEDTMTQATNLNASGAEVQSPAKPDVIVNQDALIIGDNVYLIDEIKDVEIKRPWQFWAAGAALACLIVSGRYVHAYHPEMTHIWNNYRDSGAILLAMAGLAVFADSGSAQMVLQLPDRRVQVLKRDKTELKEIRARIKEAKKAKKAAVAPKA